MVEGYQNIEGEISKMQQSLESDKESPQKLKQYSQEIGSTAQKSKDELSALATKLVSDEAKNFLATAAEKIVDFLHKIAQKGLDILQLKKPQQEIGQEHFQSLETLKISLMTELSQQKKELENFGRLETAQASLDAEQTKLQEDLNRPGISLEERSGILLSHYNSCLDLQKNLPERMNTTEGKDFLTKTQNNIKKLSTNLGYQFSDLEIAKRCKGPKYAEYLVVDEQGKITYTEKFKTLKHDNPAEYQKILGAMALNTTTTDFSGMKEKFRVQNIKVDAYRKAVEAYEKNPTPENQTKVLETKPNIENLEFPSAKERKELSLPENDFTADLYALIGETETQYLSLKKYFQDAEKHFEYKQKEVNNAAAKDVLDGLEKNWDELLRPKLTSFENFSTQDFPRLLALSGRDELLLNEEDKKQRDALKEDFYKQSEEVLRGSIVIKNVAASFVNKNLDDVLKKSFQAKIDELQKYVLLVENKRLQLRSTENLQGKADIPESQLSKFVIWKDKPDKNGKIYELNEYELMKIQPDSKREIVRGRVELMLTTDREAVQAETKASQQDLQKNDTPSAEKLQERFGLHSQKYFDSLKILESGDLRMGVAGLRDFISFAQALKENEKSNIQPLITDAREKIKLVGLRQITMLDNLFRDISTARLKPTYDAIGSATALDPFRNEMNNLDQEIRILRSRISKGENVDVDSEITAIQERIKALNRVKGLEEDNGMIGKLSGLYEHFQNLHSSDPHKKEAAVMAFQQFAKEARDNRCYDIAKKYLSIAMEDDFKAGETEAKTHGLTKENTLKLILESNDAMGNIKKLAAEYYAKLQKDNPKAATNVSLQQVEQFILRRKTDEVYNNELRKYMAGSGNFKDNKALAQLNDYFPFEASTWYKPWTYSAEEYDQFMDEVKLQALITIATLPVGMAAGAVGRGVGMMVMSRLMAPVASEVGVEVGLQLFERGGIMALRAGSAEMQMLSPALREAVLAKQSTLLGSAAVATGTGIGAEGLTMLSLNDVVNYGLTGQKPLYLLASDVREHKSFGHALVENSLKVVASRATGLSGQKMFGREMAQGGSRAVAAVAKMEAFSGIAGTGIEGTSMAIDGKTDQITPKFLISSLVQNAFMSAGTHVSHGALSAYSPEKTANTIQREQNKKESDRMDEAAKIERVKKAEEHVENLEWKLWGEEGQYRIGPEYKQDHNPETGKTWTPEERTAYLEDRIYKRETAQIQWLVKSQGVSAALDTEVHNPRTGKPFTYEEKLKVIEEVVDKDVSDHEKVKQETDIINAEFQLRQLGLEPGEDYFSSNNPATGKPWTDLERIAYLKSKSEETKLADRWERHEPQQKNDADIESAASVSQRMDAIMKAFKERKGMSKADRADLQKQIEDLRHLIAEKQRNLTKATEDLEKFIRDSNRDGKKISPQDLLDRLDYTELRKVLTPEEIQRLEKTAKDLLTQSKSGIEYYDQYHDSQNPQHNPRELFRLVFGEYPTGEVRLIKLDFGIGFECLNINDYRKIGGVAWSGGVSFGEMGNIEALKHGIVAINNNGGNVSEDVKNNLIIHEERHNINRFIFRGLGTTERGVLEIPRHQELTDQELKVAFDKALMGTITRAKDEILAYMTEGRSKDAIIHILTDEAGLYDYWGGIAESVEGMGAFRSNPGEVVAGVTVEQNGYNDPRIPQLIQKYRAQHNKLVEQAVLSAFELQNPFLLSVTSIGEWKSLSSKTWLLSPAERQAKDLGFTPEQRAEIDGLVTTLYELKGEDFRGKAITYYGKQFTDYQDIKTFLEIQIREKQVINADKRNQIIASIKAKDWQKITTLVESVIDEVVVNTSGSNDSGKIQEGITHLQRMRQLVVDVQKQPGMAELLAKIEQHKKELQLRFDASTDL